LLKLIRYQFIWILKKNFKCEIIYEKILAYIFQYIFGVNKLYFHFIPRSFIFHLLYKLIIHILYPLFSVPFLKINQALIYLIRHLFLLLDLFYRNKAFLFAILFNLFHSSDMFKVDELCHLRKSFDFFNILDVLLLIIDDILEIW
jgi:hypothetical protein